MNLYSLLEISKKYNDLGWSVQDQMETLLSNESDPEDVAQLNVNAVKMIVDFLEDVKDFASLQGNDDLIQEVDEVFERINDVFYTGEER